MFIVLLTVGGTVGCRKYYCICVKVANIVQYFSIYALSVLTYKEEIITVADNYC